MRASPLHLHRLGLLGLGLLAAPLGASAQVLYNNGGTVFVNTGGTLQVNGGLAQTGTATLRTAGTATVTGTVTNNATLDLDAGQLNVAGDLFNGLFATTAGTTGTLRLYGPANQRLSAFGGRVPNLTVDKSAGTATLGSTVQVRRVLTMADAGNLATGNQLLQLLSDATGTALVVNSGTGVITGNTAVVQRYIDGSQNAGPGYRHLSPPVSGAQVYQLSQGMFSPTVNAAYNTSATPLLETPFPTVFGYEQARLATATNNLNAFDKGWYSPADPDDALVPGQGYTAQLTGNGRVDFYGTPGTGAYTLPLARNAGATAADAGWNFLGNPYPAPLDLSTLTAAQRTNLDAAVYVFESSSQYGGNYRSYVNGVGNGNPLIGSSQGFWMRVSAGQTSGSLALNNANRVTDYTQQAPVRRTAADARPLVQLALAGATGPADAFFAYAEAGATPALDGEFDAVKMPNSSGLNLSSTANSGEALAIDGRPAFTAATVLPLAVGVPAAGPYTFTAAQLLNLPAGLTAYLRDAQTGTVTPLAAGTTYSFSVTTAQAAAAIRGRFTLQFVRTALAATPAALAAQVSVYPNPAHAQPVTVVVPGLAGTSAVQAEILNALGQVVLRQQAALPASGAQLTLPTAELAAGVYVLRLTAGSAVATKRLTIQ